MFTIIFQAERLYVPNGKRWYCCSQLSFKQRDYIFLGEKIILLFKIIFQAARWNILNEDKPSVRTFLMHKCFCSKTSSKYIIDKPLYTKERWTCWTWQTRLNLSDKEIMAHYKICCQKQPLFKSSINSNSGIKIRLQSVGRPKYTAVTCLSVIWDDHHWNPSEI